MGTTTSRTACPAPELASLWPPAVRPELTKASLRSMPASLGGPSTTGAVGRLALLLGHLHTLVGRESPPGVVPNVRLRGVKRDLQTGRSVHGTNGGRGSKDGAMQR